MVIRRVNVDIDIVVHFRGHKRGAKRGMTATAGVERTFTPDDVRRFQCAASHKYGACRRF